MRTNASAVLLGIGLTAVSLIASAQQVFAVNCTAGETINGALARGDARKPMTIQVSGTCTENVVIARDDVTLLGIPGDVTAANASQPAILVQGTRVVANGVTVTGGSYAIEVSGGNAVTIQKATLQSAATYGLYIVNGAATVTNSSITGNGQAGIFLRDATARVMNSQIFGNTGPGIHAIRNSGAATYDNEIRNNTTGILFDTGSTIIMSEDTIGPNPDYGLELATHSNANLTNVTITGNGAGGVLVDTGSTATISGGTIGPNPGNGITLLSNGSAHLADVMITQNGDVSSEHGIFASYSQVTIEDGHIVQSFGRGMVLEASRAELDGVAIEDNKREGVFGRVGSTVEITGGTINNNGSGVAAGSGGGVSMQLNGTVATWSGPVITGNNGAGILLTFASKLQVNGNVNAAGNVGPGLDCQRGEGSWMGGSISGGVSSSCASY